MILTTVPAALHKTAHYPSRSASASLLHCLTDEISSALSVSSNADISWNHRNNSRPILLPHCHMLSQPLHFPTGVDILVSSHPGSDLQLTGHHWHKTQSHAETSCRFCSPECASYSEQKRKFLHSSESGWSAGMSGFQEALRFPALRFDPLLLAIADPHNRW